MKKERKVNRSKIAQINSVKASNTNSLAIQHKKDLLGEIISTVSKTVKGDLPLIHNILFNGLSAYTKHPNHLMIMEKTSEGKTYPALQIAQLFPKENVIILAGATPQTFKYENGTLVDENYNSIQEEVNEIQEQIDSEESKEEKKKLKKQQRTLLKNSKTLIDLREKWIIFKEPPDPRLMEMLYPTLSQDEEYSEYKQVSKGSSGKNFTQTVVLRGTPAMLVCTARDETKSPRWGETFSRFHTISPKSSPEKYREGMQLIGQKVGLPSKLYKKWVVSEKELRKASRHMMRLIQNIKRSNKEIFNPFLDELTKQFPQEAGYRWRQKQRFDNVLSMRCMCYYDKRPKLLVDDDKIPVCTLDDLKWTIDTILDTEMIPPYKLEWFKEIFIPGWEALGKKISGFTATNQPVITGADIKEFQESMEKGILSVKQIRERFLEDLYEFGYIEKAQDPRNRTRDVYWFSESVDLKEGKKSLIDVSSIDESCVKSCLDKYVKRRFSFEFDGKQLSNDEVIPLILNKNVV